MQSSRSRLAGEVTFIIMLVLFSAFMLWTAYRISGFSSLTSAGAFPMVATLVMLCSACFALRDSLRLPRAESGAGEGLLAQFRRQLVPAVLVWFTVAIVMYMVLLERVGFVIASYLFLAISMRLLGSTRWVLNLGVSAACLAVIYVIFQTVFSVVLPTGTWMKGLLT